MFPMFHTQVPHRTNKVPYVPYSGSISHQYAGNVHNVRFPMFPIQVPSLINKVPYVPYFTDVPSLTNMQKVR